MDVSSPRTSPSKFFEPGTLAPNERRVRGTPIFMARGPYGMAREKISYFSMFATLRLALSFGIIIYSLSIL